MAVLGAVGVIGRRWSRLGPFSIAAALGAALAGCGIDRGGGVGDAGAPRDAAELRCPLTRGCPDWLETYEREVVGTLSGERPIADDVSLTERITEDERALVRTYLSDQLAGLGLAPELHEYVGGANVFAELPGMGEGEAVVVVGAHLDTVAAAPGAADDASGVAMVLAAARYLSELDERDQSVVFALFDQEEQGLVGSTAFAAKLRMEGVAVDGMHQFDMLSWDRDGDRGVELWSPYPELEQLYRDAAAEVGMPIASFELYSSDHGAFIAAHFAAVGLGEQFLEHDTTPYYHQPGDSYDKVDFAYLGSSTVLALRALERQLGASAP